MRSTFVGLLASGSFLLSASPASALPPSSGRDIGVCSLYAAPFGSLSAGGFILAALMPLAPAFAIATGVSFGACLVARHVDTPDTTAQLEAEEDSIRSVRTISAAAQSAIEAKKEHSITEMENRLLYLQSENKARSDELKDSLQKTSSQAVRDIYDEVERVRQADLELYAPPSKKEQ